MEDKIVYQTTGAACEQEQQLPQSKECFFRIAKNTFLTKVNTAIQVISSIQGEGQSALTSLLPVIRLTNDQPLDVVPASRVYARTNGSLAGGASLLVDGTIYRFVDPVSLRSFFVIRHCSFYIFLLAGCRVTAEIGQKLSCIPPAQANQQVLYNFFQTALGHKCKLTDIVNVEPGQVYFSE